MNWQNIKVSGDNTYFQFEDKPIFQKSFLNVLKFHYPGIAPVIDESGAYHINVLGNQVYPERFTRTFGFYCNRAAVIQKNEWFHLNEKGEKTYSQSYQWVGNYQENICSVRDNNNKYYHIDIEGNKLDNNYYLYCGDFKDGIACVKQTNGSYKHINSNGQFINDNEYIDLGIFHKDFATAKDKDGWFHIDKEGKEIYSQRFMNVEPYYNGFALVTQFDNSKIIIDEGGFLNLKI